MAKKRSSAAKVDTNQLLTRLQDNLRQLQRDAESVLGKTRKQATQLISRDQKRAVERIFTQAQRVRTDLEKRAQRASKDLESRAERFLGTLEKETTKRLIPLLRRLDLPSRHEVNTLIRRITTLERRLKVSEASVRAKTAEPSDSDSAVKLSPEPEES